MATLHIEHPISDLQTWLGASARFEEARAKAGVRAYRVRQPVDDDKYIYVTLDFNILAQAAATKDFPEDDGVGPLPKPRRRSTARHCSGSHGREAAA